MTIALDQVAAASDVIPDVEEVQDEPEVKAELAATKNGFKVVYSYEGDEPPDHIKPLLKAGNFRITNSREDFPVNDNEESWAIRSNAYRATLLEPRKRRIAYDEAVDEHGEAKTAVSEGWKKGSNRQSLRDTLARKAVKVSSTEDVLDSLYRLTGSLYESQEELFKAWHHANPPTKDSPCGSEYEDCSRKNRSSKIQTQRLEQSVYDDALRAVLSHADFKTSHEVEGSGAAASKVDPPPVDKRSQWVTDAINLFADEKTYFDRSNRAMDDLEQHNQSPSKNSRSTLPSSPVEWSPRDGMHMALQYTEEQKQLTARIIHTQFDSSRSQKRYPELYRPANGLINAKRRVKKRVKAPRGSASTQAASLAGPRAIGPFAPDLLSSSLDDLMSDLQEAKRKTQVSMNDFVASIVSNEKLMERDELYRQVELASSVKLIDDAIERFPNLSAQAWEDLSDDWDKECHSLDARVEELKGRSDLTQEEKDVVTVWLDLAKRRTDPSTLSAVSLATFRGDRNFLKSATASLRAREEKVGVLGERLKEPLSKLGITQLPATYNKLEEEVLNFAKIRRAAEGEYEDTESQTAVGDTVNSMAAWEADGGSPPMLEDVQNRAETQDDKPNVGGKKKKKKKQKQSKRDTQSQPYTGPSQSSLNSRPDHSGHSKVGPNEIYPDVDGGGEQDFDRMIALVPYKPPPPEDFDFDVADPLDGNTDVGSVFSPKIGYGDHLSDGDDVTLQATSPRPEDLRPTSPRYRNRDMSTTDASVDTSPTLTVTEGYEPPMWKLDGGVTGAEADHVTNNPVPEPSNVRGHQVPSDSDGPVTSDSGLLTLADGVHKDDRPLGDDVVAPTSNCTIPKPPKKKKTKKGKPYSSNNWSGSSYVPTQGPYVKPRPGPIHPPTSGYAGWHQEPGRSTVSNGTSGRSYFGNSQTPFQHSRTRLSDYNSAQAFSAPWLPQYSQRSQYPSMIPPTIPMASDQGYPYPPRATISVGSVSRPHPIWSNAPQTKTYPVTQARDDFYIPMPTASPFPLQPHGYAHDPQYAPPISDPFLGSSLSQLHAYSYSIPTTFLHNAASLETSDGPPMNWPNIASSSAAPTQWSKYPTGPLTQPADSTRSDGIADHPAVATTVAITDQASSQTVESLFSKETAELQTIATMPSLSPNDPSYRYAHPVKILTPSLEGRAVDWTLPGPSSRYDGTRRNSR